MVHGIKQADSLLAIFAIHSGGHLVNRVNCGSYLLAVVDVCTVVWKTLCPLTAVYVPDSGVR